MESNDVYSTHIDGRNAPVAFRSPSSLNDSVKCYLQWVLQEKYLLNITNLMAM